MDFEEYNIYLRHFIDKHIVDASTQMLYRVDWINNLDRRRLSQEFISFYFADPVKGEKRCKIVACDVNEICGYTCLLQKKCWLEKECYVLDFKKKLLIYTTLQIDILIPEEYFIIYNSGKGIAEGDLLSIFQSAGKDSYDYTKELEYIYEHKEISKQENFIIKEPATERQIKYLNSLLEKSNLSLVSINGLTKNNTDNLIKYLTGSSNIKPEIFDLYIVKKLS